jgi:DNA-binding MarR family transcriptional regulator
MSVLVPTVSIPAVLDQADGGDRKFRQLLYDIATAASHLETARAYLAACLCVTSPQYNLIMVVAQHGENAGISVNEIANHLHVRSTFVTAEVKKLEFRGLVYKRPNPADARGVLVCLSAEGKSQVEAMRSQFLLVNDHLFRHITPADFDSLSRIVTSLIGDFAHTVAMLQVMAQNSVRTREQNHRR